jgi:hypothetical protein
VSANERVSGEEALSLLGGIPLSITDKTTVLAAGTLHRYIRESEATITRLTGALEDEIRWLRLWNIGGVFPGIEDRAKTLLSALAEGREKEEADG